MVNNEDIVALYEWMLKNPYDVLLAIYEATNPDTYGDNFFLELNESINPAIIYNYLKRRLPELKRIFDKKQVL